MKIMSFIRNKRLLPGLFRGPVSNKRGFTFVELLVSMAITAIVSVALYGIYNSFYKRINIEDQVQESLQNARAGLSFMERELLNAGLASGGAEALMTALSDEIEFVYTDPEQDSQLSVTAKFRIKVKYGLTTLSGVQYLYRSSALCADPSCSATLGSSEPIISHVSGLAITYFDGAGTLITPASAAERLDVRFATIELKTVTKDILPGMTAPKEFTVRTHIRIRNLGIGTTASDITAPIAPTIIEVRDPGDCLSLKVRWNTSVSGDVAGYKIYYGTVSGIYTGVIDVLGSTLSASTYSCTLSGVYYECTITPNLPALTYSPSDGTSDTTYYIMIKAYDNSFNNSAASGVASGNPGTSQSSFGGGTSDDSTINPVKPVAVLNFLGSDGASDDQVSLTWDAYDTSTYPDVTGMRIYRSTSAMTSYPIDTTDPDIEWIAGEPGSGRSYDISASDTGFIDSSAALLGCQLYYYVIAPVNCDSTLISDGDANENGDYTKYIVSDYTFTNGDGSSGAATDIPSGADTSPADTNAPSAPVFDIRAGWKRVALSLEQPSETDTARSCVYVNEGSSYPALQTDTATYPLLNGCLRIDTSSTPAAQLIPDSGGIFTTAELSLGATTSFWHDSLASENPSVPELSEDGTFSYRTVALDICGNASGISEAQAVTVLCGEDPKIADFTTNSVNHPKPPIVTLPTVSACAANSSLSWTQVPSDTGSLSSPDNPYDLAGYRVLRSNTSDFSADNDMRTSGAPFWGSDYNDSGLADGLAYYYRVISTDCVYEATDPVDTTIIADAASNYLHSVDLPVVYPGRIGRDEKCEGLGSCAPPDDHREVLSGVDIDNASGNGDNTSTPQSSFYHDKVTIFFENTSGSTLTIQKLTVSWIYTGAYLSNVKIGGGRGGLGEISTAIDLVDTQSTSSYPEQVRTVIEKDITDVQIPADARYVPIELTFTDKFGVPVDMRDDKLLIELNIQNDSTSDTSCLSNLTISEDLENIPVPFGPSISATQQDRPTSPTFGYPVPGPSGINDVPSGADGNIVVVGNLPINITALIKSNTTDASSASGEKVALNPPVLYYIATARTVTTAPTSGYTTVNMTDTGGGNYTGAIPANDGLRLWYYIIVIDADGNFDRDPEIDSGAYSYDQDTYVFDVCDLTTNAPTALTATTNGLAVDLDWVAPTLYTDGSTIDTMLDPLTYVIYRDGAGNEIATVTDPTVVYTDGNPADPDTDGEFRYNISVKNSCVTPGPNESVFSDTAAACIGNGLGIISVDKTSILVGESFTVTIIDCLALSPPTYSMLDNILNSPAFSTFTVESTSPETITPTGVMETSAASGEFVITINTTDDVGVNASDSYPQMIHTLATGNNDITVRYPTASNSPITIDVFEDPCDSIPAIPTGFSGVMDSSGANENVILSWNEVTTNDDGTAITDLVGYNVYVKICANNKPNCIGSDLLYDWDLRTFIMADPTPDTPKLFASQGNYGNREYFFKVRAYDSCGTLNESADSSVFHDPS